MNLSQLDMDEDDMNMSERTLNEIELFETSKEREHYDNLADLYAIIIATEHLERAYARDAITRVEVSLYDPYNPTLHVVYLKPLSHYIFISIIYTVYYRM